ncbi:hypothetical protein QM298_10880 [Pseudomonas mendocina]|nr:hypothetical protein [Pseudomonas mendocina]MDV5861412.1 hypothetical protein [Pseudomonas mendocina]
MRKITVTKDIKGHVADQLCWLKAGTDVVENEDGSYTILHATVMLDWLEGEPLMESCIMTNERFIPYEA